MNDAQWKDLQEQLKALGQGTQDGPRNDALFQRKVLQEYRRRTRHEQRSKWVRRTVAVVTVCAAVWAGLFITKPLDRWHSGGVAVGQSVGIKNGPPIAVVDDSTTVYQFFDLYLQKRPEDANQYVTGNAISQAAALPLNRSNPHMTGFTMQKISGTDNGAKYQVKLNWSTYGEGAFLDSYTVEEVKQNGKWLINGIHHEGRVAYTGNSSGAITRTDGNSTTSVIADPSTPVGTDVFYAINPYNDQQLVYAEQPKQLSMLLLKPNSTPQPGPQAILYKWQPGSAPQKLATLPSGQVGEIFWMQDDLLALNFQPQGTIDQDQILFFDAKTGMQKSFPTLNKNLASLHLVNAHVVHTLPGQQLRIRSGALSMLMDLQKNSLSVTRDPNSHEASSELQQVKYDAIVKNLPNKGLQIYYSDRTDDATVGTLGVPANKRIDTKTETGLYVVNGSVQGMTLTGNELQIEVSADPGRVEVLAVPLQSLQQMQSIRVEVFDETGYVVVQPEVVQTRAK